MAAAAPLADVGSSSTRNTDVSPIRIVLATMPVMLREILGEVFSGQPDMQVVDEPPPGADLAAVAGSAGADLVVLELAGDDLSPAGIRLLRVHPRLKLLGVSWDGRTAAIYDLVPDRTQVLEVSPEGLRSAVREAMQVGVI